MFAPVGAGNRRKATVKIQRNPPLRIIPLNLIFFVGKFESKIVFSRIRMMGYFRLGKG